MSEKSPYFHFNPENFLSGTAHMNNAERGAYINLLCQQWLRESLPSDKVELARMCNGDDHGLDAALKKFKKQKNGTLINERLKNEQKNLKKSKKKLSNNGKKGAHERWYKSKNDKELNGEAIDSPLAKSKHINININHNNLKENLSKEKVTTLSKTDLLRYVRNVTHDLSTEDEEKILNDVIKANEKNKIGNPAAYVNTVVGSFLEKKRNKNINGHRSETTGKPISEALEQFK